VHLVQGDKDVLLYFSNALNLLREKLPEYEEISLEHLAKGLTIEQSWFEEYCGSRWVGQDGYCQSGLK
jgi:hypothetical protein